MGQLNLSTTIVAITHQNEEEDTLVDDVCPLLEDSDHLPFIFNITGRLKQTKKPLQTGEFDWVFSMMSVVLGSFFIGYEPF